MSRVRIPSSFVFATLAIVLAACGASGPSRTTLPKRWPGAVTASNYAEARRAYQGLADDDNARLGARASLAAFDDRDSAKAIAANDYDGVVAQFSTIAALHSQNDFARHDLATELKPLALFLWDKGASRGDESVVLAALLALRGLDPNNNAYAAAYKEVDEWGVSARNTIGSKIEAISRGIDVWEEHAALTPAPDVLARLAKLYIDRRNAILGDMHSGEGPQLSRQDLFAAPAMIQQAPLSVAAVYLERGDIDGALAAVKAMGDGGGAEKEIIRALTAGKQGDTTALLEIAMGFARGKPAAALGICRYGYLHHRRDRTFPLCLARLEAEDNDSAMATAWFREAVRVAPSDQDVYDESIKQIREFVDRAPADADPLTLRGMVAQADDIIAERKKRWPKAETTDADGVLLEKFYLAVGLMEMNAGGIDEAEKRFEMSLKVKETAGALEQLGRLADAQDKSKEAVAYFERAIALTNPGDGLAEAFSNAELLGRLGTVLEASGDEEGARKRYLQAKSILDTGEALANPFGKVEILMRRGILIDRLGDAAAGEKAFRDAMRIAQNLRSSMGDRELFPASDALQQTYARILSHLASAPVPNPVLAQDVFRAAQRQLTLDPEWKVYFALWTKLIAARAGKTADDEVTIVLNQYKHVNDWHGHLARFGAGEMTYEQLLEVADGPGQQTEAHFYAAANAMAHNDDATAARLLDLAVKLRMVNYYEFTMAQDLLRRKR